MLTVAPTWRAAALALPLLSLAASAGCDWLPVRRRVDPALYPVPNRPESAYLRGARPTAAARADDGEALARADTATGRLPGPSATTPALPPLTPVTPEEAIGTPAPTPLLDAALVRAEAVRTAAFEPPPTVVGPTTPAGPVGVPADCPDEQAIPPAEPGDLQPADEDASSERLTPGLPDPEAGPAVEPVEAELTPDPGPEPEPLDLPPPEGSPPAVEAPADEPVPPIEAGDDPVSGVEQAYAPGAVDPWRAGLEHLRAISEEQARGDSGSAEVWASRSRVLGWLAEAEADAEAATLSESDEATRWRAVMALLAEPVEAPADGSIVPAPAEGSPSGPTLRVARLAFCREVVGFGRFDPVDASTLAAGGDVIVYCELEGVAAEPEGDGHASRLATTLEIVPVGASSALWREARSVVDRCSRPRRDFFVGYWLTLPPTLPAGSYRLRVSQRDLLSGVEAAGELPFVVAR